MGFKTGLRHYFLGGWSVMIPKKVQTSVGTYYMAYSTPLDSLLHTTPFKTIQRCFGVLNCWTPTKYVYESIGKYTQQLDPFQMKVYNTLDDHLLTNNRSFLSPAKKLSSLIYSPLEARFSDGSGLKIDSWNLGYVRGTLSASSEFLMTLAASNSGTSLLEQMEANNMSSIYGPGTLKLLEEIGWSTRKNPRDIKLVVNEEAKSFLESVEDY